MTRDDDGFSTLPFFFRTSLFLLPQFQEIETRFSPYPLPPSSARTQGFFSPERMDGLSPLAHLPGISVSRLILFSFFFSSCVVGILIRGGPTCPSPPFEVDALDRFFEHLFSPQLKVLVSHFARLFSRRLGEFIFGTVFYPRGW